MEHHTPQPLDLLKNEEVPWPEFVTFTGQGDFVQWIKAGIIRACMQGADKLVLCDPDFSAWPLADDDVVSALRVWANSTSNQRMLVMLGSTYDYIEKNLGAWVSWRKMWDHRVQCLQMGPEHDPDLPGVFWSPAHMVVMHERQRYSGMVSGERQRIVREKGRLDELVRQAGPAFPASTLGLW